MNNKIKQNVFYEAPQEAKFNFGKNGNTVARQ